MRAILAVIVAIVAMASLTPAAAAPGFDHSHAAFSGILKKIVRDGLVDYRTLNADTSALTRYLDQLAAVSETDFKRWSNSDQLAFLINLYNAQTLHLVSTRYPVKSIKDIGSVLKGPWSQKVVRVFGEVETLDHIEHEILRKQYSEPRIHFALVCAAVSCPPLRNQAYVGAKLNQQLDEQGRAFLRNPKRNSVDLKGRTVRLSPIFKWFSEDFTKNGSLLEFIAPYLQPEQQELMRGEKFKVRFNDYDWSLNEIKGKS